MQNFSLFKNHCVSYFAIIVMGFSILLKSVYYQVYLIVGTKCPNHGPKCYLTASLLCFM